MKLQELLHGIDLSRTKLIRHNISNEAVAQNYERGYLDIYQSIQTESRFKGCDYVLSFLGEDGTSGKYQGCYRVDGTGPFSHSTLPQDFYIGGEAYNDCIFWKLYKTSVLQDLVNRLVIDWGKGTINWCQNGTTEKEVLYILPAVSDIEFISYDKVILSYKKLKTIVTHSKDHKEWENRLSAVAGVYLITDTKTGKHYVGSASGEQGGIWGRWNEYARTKHGGNKRLMELITADADYCNNFQFSILEVFPIKRDKHEILEYEQLYKRKLWSIRFGLNDN